MEKWFFVRWEDRFNVLEFIIVVPPIMRLRRCKSLCIVIKLDLVVLRGHHLFPVIFELHYERFRVESNCFEELWVFVRKFTVAVKLAISFVFRNLDDFIVCPSFLFNHVFCFFFLSLNFFSFLLLLQFKVFFFGFGFLRFCHFGLDFLNDATIQF